MVRAGTVSVNRSRRGTVLSNPYAAPSAIAGAAAERTQADALPLESRDADSLPYAEFVSDYIGRNRPVVVRHAVREWPVLRKWTPQYFHDRFAEHDVAVAYGQSMPFDAFIDAVLASSADKPGPYMYRLFLHEHLPALLPDLVPQNPHAFPRRLASPLMPARWRRPDGYLKLLVGGVGSKFPVMHFDMENMHATVTEIYGDKEFVMFSPDDTPYLYASPTRPNHSMVDDPCRQDREQYPLLARATLYRTVLGPGDMVFVPSRWWHTARPLNPSISVGMNILDRSNWQGFVDELIADIRQDSPAKARLAAAMFLAAHGAMSVCEAMQMHLPRLARLLGLPSWLAPAAAEWTRDPSLTPLHIRIPTA